jgi:predicted glycosyltransferase
MGKSGKVNRLEPANLVLVNERVKQLFKTAGWHRFLSKFSGENISVAQAFAQSFDGKMVTVGSRTFEMTKLIIARATQLSIDGET